MNIPAVIDSMTKVGQRHFWTPAVRTGVFLLSFTSIAALLVEFYQLMPMRLFTWGLFLPAMFFLAVLVAADSRTGDGRLFRAVAHGATSGLLAAIAYDIFRLPFVKSMEWHLDPWVPFLPLFKVFPRFGALILGESSEQAHYSWMAHAVGWAYHFSNGATFGVLYVAAVGRPARCSWLWAVWMAVGLELGMLLTPYPAYFHIRTTSLFIFVTLTAHLLFGVVLGKATQYLDR